MVVCCRYGDIIYFAAGTYNNAAICGLDNWDVRDANGRLGDWWRVEALYGADICAMCRCVSCLQVSDKLSYF
jgi:hypothetical protein